MAEFLIVTGTRPEAIKLAPVIIALRASSLAVRVIDSGQHGPGVAEALGWFGLAADMTLEAPAGGNLGERTGHLVTAASRAVADAKPTAVIVQGDTATALAGALAAYYAEVPVGHVEAGLTSSSWQPFPEEANRQIISLVASACWAPTARAAALLVRRGKENVLCTGNTAVDALRMLGVSGRLPSPLADEIHSRSHRLLLATCHRRESWGTAYELILHALLDCVRRVPDLELVFAMHPNPDLQRRAIYVLAGQPRVHLLPPLSYPDFVLLERDADVIATDSGGVQEEAVTLGVRAVVLRDVTERPEPVELGLCELAGRRPETIVRAVLAALEAGRCQPSSLFGDGHAADRIADHVRRLWV